MQGVGAGQALVLRAAHRAVKLWRGRRGRERPEGQGWSQEPLGKGATGDWRPERTSRCVDLCTLQAGNTGRRKVFKKKKKAGKREAYFASQKQFGISKLNTSEASVHMLHCSTVALNPLLSL